MTRSPMTGRAGRRQAVALALVTLLQAVAAIFFGADAVADMIADPGAPHSLLEMMVALALIFGIAGGGWQLRMVLDRMRDQERALATARGDLAKVVEGQFAAWKLTSAERDVALFALKGLDVAEIAAVRGVATGTVRAQLTRICAKADVSGRAQFAAWFVEELLDDRASSS